MEKKILIITYYFPPSGGSGVQRWLKFVKYLPEFNVEPIVLTVDEHYASYPQYDDSLMVDVAKDLRVEKTKTREILSLYKKISPTKEVPYGGFSNEKKPNLFQKISRFVRGNFFLPDPRRGWNRYAYKKACEIIEQENIQTFITTSPPHSTQLIGLKLKKRFPAIKWIADLRDPWTEIYYNKDLYQTKLARYINKHYEIQVLKTADKIITVSESCKSMFEKKVDVKGKINVISNGYDEDDFSNVETNKDNSNFVISYIGVLSPQYEIDTFIAAVKQLSKTIKQKLLIRFVGQVYQGSKDKLDNLGLKIEYVDYVPHKTAVSYMLSSDILLLIIPNISDNKGILTGKLFEYIAAKQQIALVGPVNGDAANIINKCGMNGVFAYGDSLSLSNFIEKVYNNEICCLNYNSKYYSRKFLTEQLSEIIVD
ncbi:MAG: glycosyltransferase [Bacteroidia bacterium]|nr:glycosyltransferase [Bacteroidia bacterium]